MKQAELYTYRLFSRLVKTLLKYEKTPDRETLHEIRIILKKIKSLFKVVSFCNKDFEVSNEYSLLQKIFSEAGKIRNMEVSGNLFLEFNINVESQITDPDRSLDLISSFRINTENYLEDVLAKYQDIQGHIKKLNNNCIKKYIEKRQTKLQREIYPLLIESRLHKARKICKEIIYLSDISSSGKKSLDPFYDELQDLAGLWHDKIMLIKMLKEENPVKAKKHIKILESECEKDMMKIKKIISDFYILNEWIYKLKKYK